MTKHVLSALLRLVLFGLGLRPRPVDVIEVYCQDLEPVVLVLGVLPVERAVLLSASVF